MDSVGESGMPGGVAEQFAVVVAVVAVPVVVEIIVIIVVVVLRLLLPQATQSWLKISF